MPRHELTAVLAALAGATLWGLVWMPLDRLTDLGVTGLWTTFLVFALIGGLGIGLIIASSLLDNLRPGSRGEGIPAGPDN